MYHLLSKRPIYCLNVLKVHHRHWEPELYVIMLNLTPAQPHAQEERRDQPVLACVCAIP